MAYYRLASQNRHDSTVDEVIFKSENDERKSISVSGIPVELSDQEVNNLREQGYNVVEVQEPQEGNVPLVGSDVVGMSPVIGESSAGQPAISQQGMEEIQSPHPVDTDEDSHFDSETHELS